ncbi:MAG TPA: hypothetical protein VK886_15130 [Vicinamibacterales bacterium]|nr:hypothetical protein [Vicinamibacterales bacterium]
MPAVYAELAGRTADPAGLRPNALPSVERIRSRSPIQMTVRRPDGYFA